MTPSIRDIIAAIEEAAPLSAQEEWDNSGLLVGTSNAPCTGVMLCLDVTPAVVNQAREQNANLIVSHHPIIFKGIKELNDNTTQGAAIILAIKNGIAIYCSHTSLDNAPAPWGVSHIMASMLGAKTIDILSPSGTGILAELNEPQEPAEFARKCLSAFSSTGLRHSAFPTRQINSVALGSGACGFLIPEAIRRGSHAIVTSDVRYHDFLDFGKDIFIVDLTHFDTEKCTKEIFKQIISQKFPNFAVVFCANETNPIEYM